MEAENLKSFVSDAYFAGFRRDAHQLLDWGYQDVVPGMNCNLMEEEITGLIVEAIGQKLDDPYTPEKFNRYSIHEEKPIPGGVRKGKNRRRLDLAVVDNTGRPRSTYVFEAKRLRKNGFPIGKYVGVDGLQCFIQGVYAPQESEAAMIGYMQSDDAIYWEKELNRSFNGNSSNCLCITQVLRKDQILPSMPDVWVSQHKRKVDDITIYHVFLNCQ
jgi:hypothetical protein